METYLREQIDILRFEVEFLSAALRRHDTLLAAIESRLDCRGVATALQALKMPTAVRAVDVASSSEQGVV